MFTWNMSPRHHQAPNEMSKSHTEDFPAICCDAGAECRDKKSLKMNVGQKSATCFRIFFVTSRSRTRKRTISNWQFIRWIYDVGPNFRFLAGLANKQKHTHIYPKKNPCLLVRSSTNSCKAAVPLRSVALSLCTNSCPLAAWLGPQSRIFLGRSRHMFITCWKLGNHLVKRQAMRGYRLLSYRYLGLVWLNGMKKTKSSGYSNQ